MFGERLESWGRNSASSQWGQRLASRVPLARIFVMLGIAVLMMDSHAVHAQGVLIVVDPHHPSPLPRPWIVPQPAPSPPVSQYQLDQLSIHASIADQTAKVQVSQTFVNPGATQIEAQFVFPLPYDGAVKSMTLLVDGREYPARLLPADEARNFYTETVRKNRDPALLQWLGNGMFQTSVFPIPPGAKRQVTLQYSQLCRSSDGLVEFLFPLSTAQYTSTPVRELLMDLDVSSAQPLANLYSPTHSVQIERMGEHRARVKYTAQSVIPRSDFRLFHGRSDELLPTSLLSHRGKDNEDGSFLLLASPQLPKTTANRVSKNVVLVLDRSGSMSGEKMTQAKQALTFVLKRLSDGDIFNVVVYDSNVEAFAPEMQRYTPENRDKALAFVDGLYAGGGTNIEGALTRGLEMLTDRERPSYCLFLTDGMPTVGEQSEAKLVELAKNKNQVGARLFTFGVGDDVNSRLLDKLAREVLGKSHYVRPNENIESEVARLYSRIEAPVLTDVAIAFEGDGGTGPVVNRLYPSKMGDLFAGEQIVLTGRYRNGGAVKVKITGKLAGESKTYEHRAELVAKSADDRFQFVESLWAARRVGEIVDELDLKGQNPELIQELVQLSTQYGILTPYTAFLADEGVSLGRLAENAQETTRRLSHIELADGIQGVEQRALKSRYQYAESLDAESLNRDSLNLYSRLDASAAGESAGRGGFAAPRPSLAQGPQAGGLPALSEAESIDNALTTDPTPVRTAGGKTFFLKAKQWQDASVPEDKIAKAKKIERYSEDYFKLLDLHGGELGKMLAMNEPIILELDGEVYSFE